MGDMPCGTMGKGCASSTGQLVDCCRKAAGGGGRLTMRVIKALGIAIGAAVCALSLAAGASAAPGGADRPFKGTATGLALYGAEGGGTYGLENVFDCDEAADAEDPEERAFFQVTTFTTAHGTASHLGKVHLEVAHCPGYGGHHAVPVRQRDELAGDNGRPSIGSVMSSGSAEYGSGCCEAELQFPAPEEAGRSTLPDPRSPGLAWRSGQLHMGRGGGS